MGSHSLHRSGFHYSSGKKNGKEVDIWPSGTLAQMRAPGLHVATLPHSRAPLGMSPGGRTYGLRHGVLAALTELLSPAAVDIWE